MKRLLIAMAVLALPLWGCSPQERASAGDRAEDAARDAEVALKDAGSTLSDGGITMKVKSAMSLSSKLKTSGIDVDTKDKVVHLRGTAADENQRALAERIANDTVPSDVKVVNELTVQGVKPQKAPPGPPAKSY